MMQANRGNGGNPGNARNLSKSKKKQSKSKLNKKDSSLAECIMRMQINEEVIEKNHYKKLYGELLKEFEQTIDQIYLCQEKAYKLEKNNTHSQEMEINFWNKIACFNKESANLEKKKIWLEEKNTNLEKKCAYLIK